MRVFAQTVTYGNSIGYIANSQWQHRIHKFSFFIGSLSQIINSPSSDVHNLCKDDGHNDIIL